MRAWLALTALALLYFAGVGALSVVDYDEACYAEVSRSMLERGDVLAPELNGRPFFEKPPFLYWGQMIGYRLFGVNEVGVRALNTIAALLTLLAVYLFARRAMGARVALRAVIVLGTCLAFTAVARIALTDMWLTLWLVVCIGCAHRAFEPDGRAGWLYAGAVAAGLAMLSKGAIGILLPGGALLFFLIATRSLGRLFRPTWIVPAVLIALGVGASWYLLLGLTQPGGFGFMQELFVEHHVDRFLKPAHKHHRGPFFTYLIVLFVGFQPWTFLLVPALLRRSWPEPGAGRRLLQLFGIFSLLTLVFFSIAATKLPNYATPIYPFLALMVAAALERVVLVDSTERRWLIAGRLTVAGLFVASAICCLLPLVLPRVPELVDPRAFKEAPGLAYPVDLGPVILVLGALFGLAGALFLAKGWHRRPTELIGPLAGLTLAAGVLFFVGIQPRVDAHFFRPLRRVALRAAESGPHEDRVAMVGVKYRPSTLFYGGRLTEYVSRRRPEALAALFAGPGARDAITIDSFVEAIESAALESQGRVEVVMRDTGYVLVRCTSSEDPGR